MKLAIIIFWVLYCILQGWNDARIFAHGTGHYMKQNQPYNIHTSFWINRLLVGLFTLLVYLLWAKNGVDFTFTTLALAIGLVFPFLHEGAYYSSRKKIDNPNDYPDTHFALWFSYSSPTSTAKINFPGFSGIIIPKPDMLDPSQNSGFRLFLNWLNRNVIYWIRILGRTILSRPVSF